MDRQQQQIINVIKNGFLDLLSTIPKESRPTHFAININASMSSVCIRAIDTDNIAILK
jgi:hypothetical protein